jgi:OHCU decarboxylase
VATDTTSARPPKAEQPKHPVDQVLPPGRLAVYGAQHVMAFYAGAVIVPILLATSLGLPKSDLIYLIQADLFTCGVASIIQSVGFWKVGVRLPLLQGVTFTAVAPMIAIGRAQGGGTKGLLAIYGAVIVAGVVTFFAAPYVSRLLKLFPSVVTGTVITVIGVTLLPVAAQDAGGGDPTAANFASDKNLWQAALTLVVIILIYKFFRGRFLATVAVLAGLLIGTLVSTIFGIPDFSEVKHANVVGVTTPFHFGSPTFVLTAILSMILVMFITAVETTGDVFATGEIVEKPIRRDDIARALRADGLATTIGGILNSFPYTCFAENVGLVRLTRVRSRYVVATAGGIMIVLGLFPKIGAIVASIPLPVLGGAALVMFGTVAVIGIQTLGRVDFHDDRNVVIVAVSLGLALIPVAFPAFFHRASSNVQILVGSGITLGALTAIILNLFMHILLTPGERAREKRLEPEELPKMTLDEVNELDREAFVHAFHTLFQDSPWITERAFQHRPFADMTELRKAFQDELFSAPPDKQLELLRSYPLLGRMAQRDEAAAELGIRPEQVDDLITVSGLSPESLRDQSSAGLDRLSRGEFDRFTQLNNAYGERFGFPLIIAVRAPGVTKESILASGVARLENSVAQERATAIVEVAKIGNLRLADIVREPVDVREPVEAAT